MTRLVTIPEYLIAWNARIRVQRDRYSGLVTSLSSGGMLIIHGTELGSTIDALGLKVPTLPTRIAPPNARPRAMLSCENTGLRESSDGNTPSITEGRGTYAKLLVHVYDLTKLTFAFTAEMPLNLLFFQTCW